MTTNVRIDESYKIIGGPSREELFDAARLAGEQRRVNFKFTKRVDYHSMRVGGDGVYASAMVTGIRLAEGSANSWFVTVRFLNGVGRNSSFGLPVEIYYNVASRHGNVIDANTGDRQVEINNQGDILLGDKKIGDIKELR